MKTIWSHIGMAALAAWCLVWSLASCAENPLEDPLDDSVEDSAGGKAQVSQENACKLSFRILSASAGPESRADSGDLVDGTHEEQEHKIGTSGNFVLFFDADQTLFAVSDLRLTVHEDHPEDNIEARYEATVPVDGERLPGYCLLVLNGLRIQDLLMQLAEDENGTYSVEDVLDRCLWKEEDDPKRIGRNDAGLFTLANSVYVDENGDLQTAVPIDESLIQEIHEEPDESKVLTVYVERMVAKFSFTTENDNRIYRPSQTDPLVVFDGFNDDNTLRFVARDWEIAVTGWNINALETGNYVFKHINPGSDYFAGWNDSPNYRSYWSEDPHYSETGYPWQYRKAINQALISYSDLEAARTNLLKNYSFTDLNDADFGKTVYTLENTYDPEAVKGELDGREHLLAGTHLIVCARLLSDLDGSGKCEENDLYRDRSGIYYASEKDCYRALMHAFNNTITSQSSMKYTYWNWDGDAEDPNNGKTFSARPQDLLYSLYLNGVALTDNYIKNLAWENYMMPAVIKDGDGKRLPWPEDANLEIKTADNRNLGIYEPKKDEITEWGTRLRDAGLNDIKSLLYEWLGAVDHFNQGRMYYAAPVTNPDRRQTSGENTCYGVVRNSWYQFLLTDITSVGTPVDNPADPVIPNLVEPKDQLNVTIRILDWHTEHRNVPIL